MSGHNLRTIDGLEKLNKSALMNLYAIVYLAIIYLTFSWLAFVPIGKIHALIHSLFLVDPLKHVIPNGTHQLLSFIVADVVYKSCFSCWIRKGQQ